MALNVQHPTPSFRLVQCHYRGCYSPKPYRRLFSKTPKLFSLFATQPTSSSPLIFLPFLQEEKVREEEDLSYSQDEEAQEEEAEEKEEEEEDPEDPMMRFFKSRTTASIQDPQREGKLSLQRNRRSSWHLAVDSEFVEDPESESDVEHIAIEEKEQVGSADSSSSASPEGVVGEIVRIARGLPENTTLGEVLGGYERRVGEKECVEVLGLMAEEGLLMGCLYFFEWMSLQEPTLVTPRACTVLFPVLGRAGMGEKLMLLFSNLPSKKEFKDVHVYNAAISGLLCCGRYGLVGTPLYFTTRGYRLWSICYVIY